MGESEGEGERKRERERERERGGGGGERGSDTLNPKSLNLLRQGGGGEGEKGGRNPERLPSHTVGGSKVVSRVSHRITQR